MWSEVNKKREFCILGTRFFHFQDSRRYYGSLLGVELSGHLFSCLFVTLFGKKDLLNLTNFGAVYLTQFLTDFSQILDSKSYDQA